MRRGFGDEPHRFLDFAHYWSRADRFVRRRHDDNYDQSFLWSVQITNRIIITMAAKIIYVVHGLCIISFLLSNAEAAEISSTQTPATHSNSCENTSCCCQIQRDPSHPITSGVSRKSKRCPNGLGFASLGTKQDTVGHWMQEFSVGK